MWEWPDYMRIDVLFHKWKFLGLIDSVVILSWEIEMDGGRNVKI